jgi:hypothetical protein
MSCSGCAECTPLVDVADSLTLDRGYRLMWAVDVEGDRALWVMAPLCGDHKAAATHGTIEDAPHERTGPIPPGLRRQLFGDPRCGTTRTNGLPCANPVRWPGDRCHLHAEVNA